MDKPLISVIIPTYNDEKYIVEAVDSIIKQTYQNLEIIIIDDNSTDTTPALIKEIAKKDSRIRVLTCPFTDPHRIDWRGVNISVGYLARNYAMDQSRGEWITFQDADDTSVLNRIEVQLDLAQKYNATLLTTSWQGLTQEKLNKKLNVEAIFKNEKVTILTPKELTAFVRDARGTLMAPWFPRQFVPFMIKKWFPGFRKLFFGKQTSYPGADNSMFFKREIIKDVRFRRLRYRQWPALSGRGVGRDFVCQVADRYENSWSIFLPLYLWRVNWTMEDYKGWEKYLVD